MHAHEWGRGRESGRERVPSRPFTVSTEPDMGLELMNREILTRNQESDAQPTEPPQHPGI